MSDFDLEQFLPYQLVALAERVSRAFEAEYKARYGISVAEWRVVAHLGQSAQVSVRDIHKTVRMEKSRVTRAAQRLEAAGHITRRPHATDRRLVMLELTDRGQAMLNDLIPVAKAFEADLLNELKDDEAAFRRSIATLLRNPSEPSDAPRAGKQEPLA